MTLSIIPKHLWVAVVLAIVFVLRSSACIWEPTDNYYLFYAFEGDRTATEAIQKRLTAYWSEYAGVAIHVEDLDTLANEDYDALAASKHPIVRSAFRKGDRQMQQYLKLLCEYLQIAPKLDDYGWYYPDEEEFEEMQQQMLDIATRASRVNVPRLAPQYALLRLRALFHVEQWSQIVKLWSQIGATLPESVFKDMAMGYYAGALRKMGRDEDAAEIYATLGDIHSASWCVHDGRNLGTIRRLYQQDPNGPAVRLLVQDFVNNAQETLDNPDANPDLNGSNGYISRVYQDEVQQFIAFALEAAENPAVSDACMWLTAAAWVEYLYEHFSTSKELIDRAMTARGTDAMHTNARIIRIVIYSDNISDFNDFQQFLTPELQWLSELVKANKRNEYSYYVNASQRIYLQHLHSVLQAKGFKAEALLCRALADQLYDYYETDYDNAYEVHYYTDWATNLMSMRSDDLQEVYQHLSSPTKSPLCQWLYSQLDAPQHQDAFYFDLIGTALMREGKFAEAEAWLEKVSLDFLSAQRLSYYMARRDYTRERWKGPRQTLREVRDGYGGEGPTPLHENQRLKFCRDVQKVQQQLAHAANDNERAQHHYRLASLLFQGSSQGDCWYLTQYGRSCEPLADYLDTLAYHHLCEAEKLLQGSNSDLYTTVLFAKTYINLDKESDYFRYNFYSYNYDWEEDRYTLAFFPDATKQQSRDYEALRTYLRSQPRSSYPAYVTHCDVVMTWLTR